MQVDCSQLSHQQQNPTNQKHNLNDQKRQILMIQTGRQSNEPEKQYQNKPFFQKLNSMKVQQCSTTQKPKSHQTNQKQSPVKKKIPNTYRSTILQSYQNSSDFILVYLMYKDQKLSLFLNKGVPFEYMIHKMYKEIYIYEKQTYSISNAILKNLLYKITGFESIDNDILYDYQLKYKRGVLIQQKFFVPFKQEDHKMPFKIYTIISQNLYGGHQFLARNYSDGEWAIINTIKKNIFDQEKINIIKKSLKTNAIASSLLLKNSSSSFNQINWLETKHYLIVISEYSIETLEQNLIKNHSTYHQQNCQEIFVYYSKWFAQIFKQIVSSNVQNFKKISLQNVELNPSDGHPKISVFNNLVNIIDFEQKRKILLPSGKRASEKIQDIFYFDTYLHLVKSMQVHLKRGEQNDKFFINFLNFLESESTMNNFTFDSVFSYFSTASSSSFQKQKEKHPLKIDFTSKLSKIISKMHVTKINSNLSDNQTLLISEVKQEIQKIFCMENMLKSQQRNEAKSVIQILTTNCSFGDIKKQNIGNLTDFKKEEERKYNLKKKERLYVQEILSELSQNENFIKTTKENNLASIQFYLKKSDEKVKKKIVDKIETKYKKFLEIKVMNFSEDAFNQNAHGFTARHDLQIEDMDVSTQEKSYGKQFIFPNCTKSRRNLPADSYTIKQQSHTNLVSSFLEKENFASQILSRLEQRNGYFKPINMQLKNSNDPGSPILSKKVSKLEQLFINKKNYSKEEKIAMKKKQYGIYLEEAEKQFNKIRLYRKPKIATALK